MDPDTPGDAVDRADLKRWTVGNVRITRILELAPMAFDPAMFLQTTREEVLARGEWLIPEYATEAGDIILHFQAFIIEAGGRRIMVDPCIGNAKPRSHPQLNMLDTDFLERLSDAGLPRESIDFVLCTHLHVDHCGWNTMFIDGQWVTTFPNARYLFGRSELDHARSAQDDDDAAAIYQDSVQPIIDAGLCERIEPGFVIVEGVSLEPTPGHTPGHCSVFIKSLGQEAILAGDVVHHPVQMSLPHVSSNFCWDKDRAVTTRRTMLDRAAKGGALLIPAHFAGPTGVKVEPDGDAWRAAKP